MIRDFAATAIRQGADVRLDVWPHMTHEFQAYGSMLTASRDALLRFSDVIEARLPKTRH